MKALVHHLHLQIETENIYFTFLLYHINHRSGGTLTIRYTSCGTDLTFVLLRKQEYNRFEFLLICFYLNPL